MAKVLDFSFSISPYNFPGSSEVKASACNAGDQGSIPGLGRSTGEGNGNPLQYSGLENSMDCIVHGIAKSWTRLSNFHTFNSSQEVAKVLEFQLQHQSFQTPGLISFRMDWLDLLAVQGTFKSLLQQHSSKASVFQCSAFFMVQLSYSYMTTGKTIALTIQTFVRKVISLLFKMLSKFVIAFLSKARHLLISWLQSLSSDFGTQENKVCHCFLCFPIYLS